MAIEVKRPPSNVALDATTLTRIVNELYGHLNEVINAVNKPPAIQTGAKESDGKAGDMRLSKTAEGHSVVEVKFSDGWYVSGNTTFSKKVSE